MSERIDKVAAVIDLARRIAEGGLSETDAAIAILKFVHECEDEARDSMADALMNRRREAA
jgi:hypothetical protein